MTAAAMTLPRAARRAPPCLRRPKALTRRELEASYAKIAARVLKGGEPFGVFVLKHGRGRRVMLYSVRHANYERQLREGCSLGHYIGTYDKDADLLSVWEDLYAFDRDPLA